MNISIIFSPFSLEKAASRDDVTSGVDPGTVFKLAHLYTQPAISQRQNSVCLFLIVDSLANINENENV